MSEQSAYQKARAAFDQYVGIDPNAFEDVGPNLDKRSVLDKYPIWRKLQIRCWAWQLVNFGHCDNVKGLGEELGETALGLLGIAAGAGKVLHASLKTENQIRGFSDPEKGRQAVSDGIADVIIFALQVCSQFRLDFQTLVEATAEDVLQRDWVHDRLASETAEPTKVPYEPTAFELGAELRRREQHFQKRASFRDCTCFVVDGKITPESLARCPRHAPDAPAR